VTKPVKDVAASVRQRCPRWWMPWRDSSFPSPRRSTGARRSAGPGGRPGRGKSGEQRITEVPHGTLAETLHGPIYAWLSPWST
jgi:hypothetical protein